MQLQTMSVQIGAVVIAVALGGSYVWFRAAGAQQPQVAPVAAQAPATHPAMQPTTSPVTTAATTQFTDLLGCLSYNYHDPYPDSNAVGAGFKLNNSISAEFAVSSDICPGLPDPAPSATAPPSNQGSRQP
jgi:hypothetical protein